MMNRLACDKMLRAKASEKMQCSGLCTVTKAQHGPLIGRGGDRVHDERLEQRVPLGVVAAPVDMRANPFRPDDSRSSAAADDAHSSSGSTSRADRYE